MLYRVFGAFVGERRAAVREYRALLNMGLFFLYSFERALLSTTEKASVVLCRVFGSRHLDCVCVCGDRAS